MVVGSEDWSIDLEITEHFGLTVSWCRARFEGNTTTRTLAIRAVPTPGNNARAAVLRFYTYMTLAGNTRQGHIVPDIPVTARMRIRILLFVICDCERRDMLVPRTRTELGRRSFPVAAPTVRNSLPAHLRSTLISRRQFRDGLKSHLFADAYF